MITRLSSFASSFAGAVVLMSALVFGAMFTAYSCTRAAYAQEGSGSAMVVDAGSASAPAPDTAQPAPASTLDELSALKAKYEALKTAQPDAKMLAWAALIAAALKLMLSLFNRYVFKETKTWTKWIALGAAVPIALLSYYALGNGLFASLVYAGAGPGAIIVHELLQKKAPSSS
ncbi:MAG TPA: hypothetical protein VFV99_32340 [Kofleriaceae bacterium]|nr:hypothetical protein [Kofleriaceae bacterium]